MRIRKMRSHKKRIEMTLIHTRSYPLHISPLIISYRYLWKRYGALFICRLSQRAMLPIAQIVLLSVRRKFCSRSSVYTRASPRLAPPRRCTIFRIYPAAAMSLNAGFYDRAWVRKYNPVTQVRRRKSDRRSLAQFSVRYGTVVGSCANFDAVLRFALSSKCW